MVRHYYGTVKELHSALHFLILYMQTVTHYGRLFYFIACSNTLEQESVYINPTGLTIIVRRGGLFPQML